MRYQVGVDLGTTYSAAAVCRSGADAVPEIVPLAGRTPSVASVVFLAPDGSFLIGEAAERRALTEPGRIAREFKRRIGDVTPIVIGGLPFPAEVVAARFVGRVLAQVIEREGASPSHVAITHPAAWGPHKRRSFAVALAGEGVPAPLFLTEPQAAAIGYAGAEHVEPGGVVAVYDLGGGTFDAALLRRAADGRYEVLGRPKGIERLGGVDFDEVVFEHVLAALGPAWQAVDKAHPAVTAAVAGLRRQCTSAKEALSADTEVLIPVMVPGLHTQVRLGRAEFEELIRPAVVETIEMLRRAVESPDMAPTELDAVLLVGGSSRIPLVAQLISAEFGLPIAVDADPQTVVAAGAALAARGPLGNPVAAPDPTQAGPAAAQDEEPDESLTDSLLPGRPPKEARRPLPVDDEEGSRRHWARSALLGAAASVVAVVALASTIGSGNNPLGSNSVTNSGGSPAEAATGQRPEGGATTPGAAPRTSTSGATPVSIPAPPATSPPVAPPQTTRPVEPPTTTTTSSTTTTSTTTSSTTTTTTTTTP